VIYHHYNPPELNDAPSATKVYNWMSSDYELLGYGNDESLPYGTNPTLTWTDMFVIEPWLLPRTSQIRSRHSINNLLSKWRPQSEWLEVVTAWVSRSRSSGTWHSVLLIHSKVLEEPASASFNFQGGCCSLL
jgi:hypothetical protein